LIRDSEDLHSECENFFNDAATLRYSHRIIMSSLKKAVTSTDLSSQYKFLATGKVRDLYEIDASTLLFVATDRVSAFDVVCSIN
jgi:hypothetical protein